VVHASGAVRGRRASRAFVLPGVTRFREAWHEGDGAGSVCQVNRGECEIILCEDPERKGQGRLFIELTPAAIAELRREIAERSIASKTTQWGYETIQIDDPDGNELYFPIPE
jgi:hypothetical protein